MNIIILNSENDCSGYDEEFTHGGDIKKIIGATDPEGRI